MLDCSFALFCEINQCQLWFEHLPKTPHNVKESSFFFLASFTYSSFLGDMSPTHLAGQIGYL